VAATALGLAGSALSSVGAAAAAPYHPDQDPYSMAATAANIGAPSFWNAGYTGAGVDVAVIDSGVSPVPGLDQPGKVINGPDLSFESQAPNLTNLDTFGHGTFMAGLIAGHDAALQTPYATAPADEYRGIAPDARIVNVKVAVANGEADVTQVIAAIDWVVQHKNDNGMHIRIINLSYGTNSTQSESVDPLSYAVEQAWKHGIVVVASAGNTGYQRGHGAPGLADPAYNPYIIGVGAYDAHATSTITDDTMASYSASSAGCGSCKNPDFVAVGSHLQGLRDPNSYIDQKHLEGQLGTLYARGSGTSEAAAITSGSIALILQKYPNLTPDEVKHFIMENAKKVPSADDQAQGAGEISLAALAAKAPKDFKQGFPNANGGGSVELSRGSDHVSVNGATLTGEVDIFGAPFNSQKMARSEATASSWDGGTWNGHAWTGNTWSGDTWSGTTWTSVSWTGNTWSSVAWSGATWSGNTWSGNTWSGHTWSGNTWSGDTWS
jgi:serine protease AprX